MPPSTTNPPGVQPSVSAYPSLEAAKNIAFARSCPRTRKTASRQPARRPSRPKKRGLTVPDYALGARKVPGRRKTARADGLAARDGYHSNAAPAGRVLRRVEFHLGA